MGDGETYLRNERGAWVPTNNADSLAEEMTNPGDRIWFGVRSWTIWETNSYAKETDDPLTFDAGERHTRRLRLELDTSRRIFHTIRESGTERVAGPFHLDLFQITKPDEEVGGHIKHWGPARHEPERNDLLGTAIVRESALTRLLDALKASERVSIGLGLKVYKRGIAHSFDEDWMMQDLYIDWEATIPLDFFAYQISEERKVEGPADSNEEFDAKAPTVAENSTAANVELTKRLNWIVILLALIVALLLIRR